MMKAIELR